MGLWSAAAARSRVRKPAGNETASAAASATDVELMLDVSEGDEQAFGVLYDRYHRRVQDFFYGLARDPQSAADLCQETFFRIWRVRRRYAATGSFPSYLFTFARNIWLEHCRALRKVRRLGYRDSLESHWHALQIESAHEPDASARRAELRQYVFDALDELPDEQRMVFVLRNIDGLSLDEIATIMQCPVNTVRSRKLLAQKKIRDHLRERMVTPGVAL